MPTTLLPGLHNVGEFFAANYFGEDLERDVLAKAPHSSEDLKEIVKQQMGKLRPDYEAYKRDYLTTAHQAESQLDLTRAWHDKLLAALGYGDGSRETTWLALGEDGALMPVRQIWRGAGGVGERPQLMVVEMEALLQRPEQEERGLYDQRFDSRAWEAVARSASSSSWATASQAFEGERPGKAGADKNEKRGHELELAGARRTRPRLYPGKVTDALRELLLLPEDAGQRPRFVLLLAGNWVFLLEEERWLKERYLGIDLDELFASATTGSNYRQLLYSLVGKPSLVPAGGQPLLDQLTEESHRKAVAVTKDLKRGVIGAVETLANEVLWWARSASAGGRSASSSSWPPALAERAGGEVNEKDVHSAVVGEGGRTSWSSPNAPALADDCLRMVYRLLFLFYAESRSELELLPLDSEVYRSGYSLEMLRDLEQVPLETDEARDGYFIHESLTRLFALLWEGHSAHLLQHKHAEPGDTSDGFGVRRIDSPLFDPHKLRYLGRAKIRNVKWQEILRELSLSKKDKKRARGRISYANLDINQLGSVYEGLLAFRGIIAEEELIEVHKLGKPDEGTFLVPRRRLDDFAGGQTGRGYDAAKSEVLHDEHGRLVTHAAGSFVYRLSGRDRQKSASYYTPESLTRTTVWFALEEVREALRAGGFGRNGRDGDARGARQDVTAMRAADIMELRILEPAMGAAAFQNEAINQLADLYLEYRQLEVVAAGGKRIAPSAYQQELRRVKAHLAANNVYGVDLNATAIELGRLSLWLNGLHTDMEAPYFGHRLGYGNAVVGCWLRAYPKARLVADKTRKKTDLEWWTTEPTDARLPFHTRKPSEARVTGYRKPERSAGSVYHFLLGDPGMAAAADNNMVKARYKEEAAHARNWRKSFCQPLTEREHGAMLRLSAKLDELLVEHLRGVDRVNALNASNRAYYGAEHGDGRLQFSYRQKEAHLEQLRKDDAPYARIRLVMDYWCALWYWDIRDARSLPSRQQYLADVAAILEVDLLSGAIIDLVNDGRDVAGDVEDERAYDLLVAPAEQPELFDDQLPLRILRDRETMYESARDKLMALSNRPDQFWEEHPRLRYVSAFAKTHRFFHQQLEFYEVYARRGGFDLVVGNPPWIKLEFDESGIVSELDPRVEVRKTSAPQVRRRIAGLLEDEAFAEMYFEEATAIDGASNFLNAYQNYPLLKGQQTNLYKCIVEVGFRQIGEVGRMGLVHPEGLYDDPKGAEMRRAFYPRLRYHLQFKNELMLFEEIDHHVFYGIQVYGSPKQVVRFVSMSNLFDVNTAVQSIQGTTQGELGGYKTYDEAAGKFVWNTNAHPDRVVHIDQQALLTFAQAFEDSDDWEGAKLVSVHAKQILSVLEKLSRFKGRVGDVDTVTTECWHETNSQNDGNIEAKTTWPDLDAYELIYSGPHFFVGTPFYKTPRAQVKNNSDYDTLDLTRIAADFVPRTNYVPARETVAFAESAGPGKLPWGGRWVDGYKVALRQMLSVSGERTLHPAILPPKVTHIHTVVSTSFKEESDALEYFSFGASLVCDFFIKTIGAGHVYGSTMSRLPHGLGEEHIHRMRALALRLNCLTEAYAPLWSRNWDPSYSAFAWRATEVDLPRLRPFAACTPAWSYADSAVRTPYERRWALVELDVLVAQALGLTLEELVLIYEVQFPVLQQNELETWYDARGQVVWTVSKGLKGVGIHDRKEWEALLAENRRAGDKPYRHVVDGKYSELYAGEERYYWPPYATRDRVGDYGVVWNQIDDNE